MAKRRAFVPAAPVNSSLEERIAPTNIFGLGSWWDKQMTNLGFHHKLSSNTDIVASTWKHSKELSRPTHVALQGSSATVAHHNTVAFTK